MAHAVTRPREPFEVAGGKLRVHQIPSASDNLIWLVEATDGSEVAAVDGPEAGSVLEYCERQKLTLTAIINTHTHFDHIGINQDLDRRGMLSSLRVVGPKPVAKDVPGINEEVDEGDTVTFGGVEGKVMLTEGHIDGHVSYLFRDALFCGDTLFAGGCGYLFDGPPEKMFRSLSRLAELDGDTWVCCAHEYTQDNLKFAWSVEPDNEDLAGRIREVWALRKEGGCTVPSKIRDEVSTNPFMRFGSDTVKKKVTEAWPGRDLVEPKDIFAATRALKDRKDYREMPDSELPLD